MKIPKGVHRSTYENDIYAICIYAVSITDAIHMHHMLKLNVFLKYYAYVCAIPRVSRIHRRTHNSNN